MKDVVTVKEYERIQRLILDQSEIDYLRELGGCVVNVKNGHLTATNYVGIFTTRSGVVIEILPKIDLGSDADHQNQRTRKVFLSMLRHWRGKGFKQLTDSQIQSLRRFPMLEAFVHLFLINVHELVRHGLARRYVQIEENLTYLRGRLLFTDHIRENMIDQSRFFVSHDEFSENRPANRLIHKVLQLLTSQVTDSINFQSLQQAKVAFADIPPSNNIHADWQNHYVDRNMKSYESVMQWVKLFLFNEGLTTYSGKHDNVSLLFPMEQVFEDFVTHSFRRYQYKYRVQAQGPREYLATKDNHGVFAMKPDISLISNNTVNFILDAKWKEVNVGSENRKHNVDQHDMYQLFAYGKNYGCKAVALVFPKTDRFDKPFEYKFSNEGLILKCLPFDVEKPEKSVSESMVELEKLLK